MKINSKKPKLGFFGFIYKHKITLIFLVIFIALFRQNILINGFPMAAGDRQNAIDNINTQNTRIAEENKALEAEINNYKADLVLVESQARYKYGLIKEGETYYQINTLVEADNSDETPESNL